MVRLKLLKIRALLRVLYGNIPVEALANNMCIIKEIEGCEKKLEHLINGKI